MTSSDQKEPLPDHLEDALGDAFWRDANQRERLLIELLDQHEEFAPALNRRIAELKAQEQTTHLGASEISEFCPPVDAVDVGPRSIGPFEIIRELGEGGMGTVYLAEQTHPIRRRVALKLIKLGMDTRSFVRRFEAERQALAMMEHTCIAKVFDAGATDQGRPYYVMEFVQGEPITGYIMYRLGDYDVESDSYRLKLYVVPLATRYVAQVSR